MAWHKLASTLAAAGVALLAANAAQAQAPAADFPGSKPITFVVPYPPGGFNDTLARTVSDRLSKSWKISAVVDNRPGGNTLIGNNLVAAAQPDGHTLLITPLPFSALPGLYGGKLNYDALKDFAPVIWAGSTQNILVVRESLGIDSVQAFIDYAKKHPGKLNYGSTGSGSSNHLSMELFMQMTGTEMTHVPYKGSAPAVVAMLGGEIDALFDNIPNLSQHIKGGKLKALAVTGSRRTPLFPDLPTVAEAGVPGYEVNVWFGIQAPGKTPPPVVQKLNAEIARLIRQPDVVKLFGDQGVEVVASTPEAFFELVAAEVPKWTRVIQEAGIKVE
ncbi:tripartite tricarboxylate transporter substrate binding protein [Orrella sp. JC864]|uniref:tripartite tricarboxylate transporter substrate binding protein n=1 Tax=Orrella sp. JC864 TaxID=3120298 RepID=UPI003008B4C2